MENEIIKNDENEQDDNEIQKKLACIHCAHVPEEIYLDKLKNMFYFNKTYICLNFECLNEIANPFYINNSKVDERYQLNDKEVDRINKLFH